MSHLTNGQSTIQTKRLAPPPQLIRLSDRWTDVEDLELAILRVGTFGIDRRPVIFQIPAGGRVLIGAAVRLLSIANQLAAAERDVIVEFEGEYNEALGYLQRAGFFQPLDPRVIVLPSRPDSSRSNHKIGQSENLVEVQAIPPYDREAIRDLPSQLADRLNALLYRKGYADKAIGDDVYTLFGELLGNIYDHSETILDGLLALQVYRGGGRVQVAVSDSGIGLLESLRPHLAEVAPELQGARDGMILGLMFQEGVSRLSKDRGVGIKRCVEIARKYGAQVDLRLTNSRVNFVPAQKWYSEQVDYHEGLPSIRGTHFCFSFALDS